MPVIMKSVSVIKARLGIEPNGRAHRKFTHSCKEHMEKYVPMKKGKLRKKVIEGPDFITYTRKYAHAQYVGYTRGPVKHYTTPGTGPYWDKRMVSAEMQDVVKEVQDYIGGR